MSGRKGGGGRGTVWELVRGRKGWRRGREEGEEQGLEGHKKSRGDEVWGGAGRTGEDCQG